jgi:hypothetical protein
MIAGSGAGPRKAKVKRSRRRAGGASALKMKSEGMHGIFAVAMLIALLVALLAGCSSIAPERRPTDSTGSAVPSKPSDRVNLSGYSPAFKQGYSDGCDSAGASRRRDERRYKAETDYMMGWNDGNSACLRKR